MKYIRYAGFVFFVLLVAGIINTPACISAGLSADDLFAKAKDSYCNQHFAEAENLFKQCVDQVPDNAEYKCWLAQSTAFIMAEQAMKGVSSLSLIPTGRTIQQLYKDAIAVNPKSERARIGYATLLRDIPGWLGGDVDKAESLLQEVIKENPQNLFALHNLGTLYIRKRKDTQKGLDYLQKAVALEKSKQLNAEEKMKLSNSYHAIGKTYLDELKDPNNALIYFEKSNELDSVNIVTLLDLVTVYKDLKQEDKAKDVLRKAYSIYKENNYKHFTDDIKRSARKLGMSKEIAG